MQAQWIDRFLDRLSTRLPSISIAEANEWADDAWRIWGPDLTPEHAVVRVMADRHPHFKIEVDAILHVDRDVILASKQRARGVAAATAVFRHAGMKPDRCASAYFEREGWDLLGRPRWITPTAQCERQAEVWAAATAAAKDACGGDLYLELVPPGAA